MALQRITVIIIYLMGGLVSDFIPTCIVKPQFLSYLSVIRMVSAHLETGCVAKAKEHKVYNLYIFFSYKMQNVNQFM